MNKLTKSQDQSTCNNELPDVVLKALIAQKLQEIEKYSNECTKLDNELKDKKFEYELWKTKIEVKQRERRYWKEALERATKEEEKLKFKISLINANLSPMCKEMAQELKNEEHRCEELRKLWENYKAQWESKPLAIKRREVLQQLLHIKFDISLLKNKIAFAKKMRKLQDEADEKRLQAAIISFARVHVDRLKSEDELFKTNEMNEELKSNLALLKSNNVSHSTKADPDHFLMPPPSMHFSKKPICAADTISMNSMLLEDILQSDTESVSSKQFCKSNQIQSIMTDGVSENILNEESNNPPSENEYCLQQKIFKQSSTMKNMKNLESDIQECSSTVNDNTLTSFVDSPPVGTITGLDKDRCSHHEMDITSSVKSENFDNYCACSSINMNDCELKHNSSSRKSFNLSLNKNNSFKSSFNVDEMNKNQIVADKGNCKAENLSLKYLPKESQLSSDDFCIKPSSSKLKQLISRSKVKENEKYDNDKMDIDSNSLYMGDNNAMDCSRRISDCSNRFSDCSSIELGKLIEETKLTNYKESTISTKPINNNDMEIQNSIPVVKSVEKIENKYKFFSSDFDNDPSRNMFSTRFTPNLQSKQTIDDKNLSTLDKVSIEMEWHEDNLEENKRSFSPVSAIDAGNDSEMAESTMSNLTYLKKYGNISPPSLKSNITDAGDYTGKTKKLKPSLYSNIQTANFMEQTNTANLFNNDKKTSLF